MNMVRSGEGILPPVFPEHMKVAKTPVAVTTVKNVPVTNVHGEVKSVVKTVVTTVHNVPIKP